MLAPGTSLGPYEIVAPLGAGGMGEVYRARDTRLGRDVAVKVLPQHLAATPEVRARFEREARTVSQLDHPHICTLHDVGREGETDYLVMELLEGETLARRLEKGALPVADVLRMGGEIAAALDAAHRAGVVHRDLKPGNVMLTKIGAKLMDFGLARGSALPSSAPGVLDDSPTVSRPLTREGTIVGTFQYMAPEQLEGREADARSDIWALGCVLYEAATGQRAFEGASQASLISAIMKDEPRPITELQPLSPPALEHAVKRCLAKDPGDRWQSARDVTLELQWIVAAGSQAGVLAAPAPARRARGGLLWLFAGAVAGAIVVGTVLSRHEPARPVRFDVPPPSGTTDVSWPRVSPDGRTLAFLAADSSGAWSLWTRSLGAVEARAWEEVEGLTRPFWSPDGRYLAFLSGGKLRKIPAAGGPVVDVCDVPGGSDGTWGASGWILFDGGLGDSIRGVPVAGGTPRPVTFIDRAHGETQHGWPCFLPDGRHFLYVADKTSGVSEIRMGSLGSKETRLVGHTQSRVEYATPGWLVYTNGGRLMAQRFDARSARTTGEAVPVGGDAQVQEGDFSAGGAGVLAYRPDVAGFQARLLWLGRDGSRLGEVVPAGNYQHVELSPEGRRLAVTVGVAPALDIWVLDLARGGRSRLTFDPGDEACPIWSPDGRRILYFANRGGVPQLRTRAASGVGADSLLLMTKRFARPYDWSGSVNAVLFGMMSGSKYDIWVLPLGAGGPSPRPVIESAFDDQSGRLSPDGRWLAYDSDESGRYEVYVVPYPGPGGKWQVSTGGGSFPQWRADGKELFFQGLDQSIMAVDVRAASGFEAGVPRPLFKTRLINTGMRGWRWAVSRDGLRFLVVTPAGRAAAGHIVVATDWTRESRAR